MLHKVFCNGAQPFICGEDVNFLCKFPFQLFLLRGVEVGSFNSVQNPPGDFRLVQLGDLIRAVLIVQRHRCAVLHRPLEVIHRQIPAKGALGDMVIRQQRRARKADAGRRGQQVHHVVCKNAVLAAVSFVRQDQHIVIRVDGRLLGQVELLNQGKHKAGVALQLFYKVCTAGCNKLRSLGLAQQTAVFKGIADLPVQFVTVGQHHNGGRTCKLAPDLLRQKDHGVAFAGPLRVPEHTQPAVFQFAVLVGTHRFVDAKILVVAGQDLGGAPAGMVVKDEVFQQIEEGLFLADAPQHGFQLHSACIALFQALPLVEKLVLAAKCAHLGFQSIGQHEKGIVIEQLRNSIEVIPIIVYVGVLHIHGGLF